MIRLVPNASQTSVLQAMHVNSNQRAKLTNWQSHSKGWVRTTLTISAANLAPPRLLGSIGFAKSSTSSWKEVDCRWLLSSLDLDLNLMHTSMLHRSRATLIAVLLLHLNHLETLSKLHHIFHPCNIWLPVSTSLKVTPNIPPTRALFITRRKSMTGALRRVAIRSTTSARTLNVKLATPCCTVATSQAAKQGL